MLSSHLTTKSWNTTMGIKGFITGKEAERVSQPNREWNDISKYILYFHNPSSNYLQIILKSVEITLNKLQKATHLKILIFRKGQ